MVDETFEDLERLVRRLPKGIGGSLELLLSNLDEGMQRLVRLSAIPHRFNFEILEILEPDLAKGEIEQQYHRLSELSFVVGPDDNRMMHDEARSYLFSCWLVRKPTEPFRDASRRLADYFQNLVGHLSGIAKFEAESQFVFHLTGADLDTGFREFSTLCRRERSIFRLANCQVLITGMQEYKKLLSRPQCAWLAYHDAKLLVDRRHWSEAQRALDSLVTQARGLPDLLTRVWFRFGLTHAAQSEWTAAVDAFNRAEALAKREPKAADQLDRIYDRLAAVYRDMGELNRAAELYGLSIVLAKRLGNTEAMASTHNGLGILHRIRGDTQLASQAFEQSLSLLPSEGSKLQRAQMYNNIGLIHADDMKWETSRDYLERSLNLFTAVGDSVGQAKTLTSLIRTYINLEMLEQAVRVGHQAQELFLLTHEWTSAAIVSRDLARTYRRSGEIKMALNEFTRAEGLYKRSGFPDRAKAIAKERAKLLKQTRPSRRALVVVGTLLLLVALSFVLALFRAGS